MDIKFRIADISADDRPRERLARLGPDALTNAELLALLIGSGTVGENAIQLGERLLQKFGDLDGIHRAKFEEICSIKGIGAAKASRIIAAVTFFNRLGRLKAPKKIDINEPWKAAELVLNEMSDLEQEHLRVILLNNRNMVLDDVEVYKGSVNSAQIIVGEIFKAAVRRGVPSIIVVHNHPSGDPTPSTDDIAVTKAVVKAGQTLDISVLDHIVIGRGNYKSIRETLPQIFK